MENKIINLLKCLVCCVFILHTTPMKAQQQGTVMAASSDMLLRISEIEIFPEHLESYNAILKEEAAASVKIEPGVIAIFPMYVKESPNQIRIIEIYASKQAYLSHLETAHFKYYKTETLKMVKSLKLVDMTAMDTETMKLMFRKMQP